MLHWEVGDVPCHDLGEFSAIPESRAKLKTIFLSARAAANGSTVGQSEYP